MNYLSVDMQTFEVLKDISLLYVEDDAATREELTMILEPWLGKLHVASDGQAGLTLFTQQRPDIVVTDIQMPKINGLVMSGKIREIVPGQAIVVVSAYNDVEYLFKAIELGIDHYVTKPVNVELLLKKLAAMANGIFAARERERSQALLAQNKMLVDQARQEWAPGCFLPPTVHLFACAFGRYLSMVCRAAIAPWWLYPCRVVHSHD